MIVFGRNRSKLLRILKVVSIRSGRSGSNPVWSYFRIGGQPLRTRPVADKQPRTLS